MVSGASFEPRLDSFRDASGLSDHPSACCGMPHLGARYTGRGVNAYRLDEGAPCAFCGRPAAHAHHEPPKGTGGGVLHLGTPHGVFDLRPALVALCPECHDARHAGGGEGRHGQRQKRQRREQREKLFHGSLLFIQKQRFTLPV